MAIKGLDSLVKKIRKLDKDANKKIDAVTDGVALEIELNAKQSAPVDTGKLRQGINTIKVSESYYKIQARERYSAYIEFGTGGLVNVPDELKELAIQFKGKGVKQINLKPQPFLYPAFQKGKLEYIEQLEKLLNKMLNE